MHGTLPEPVCYFPEKKIRCSDSWIVPDLWNKRLLISKNVILIRLSQRYRKVPFHMKACFYCTVDIIPCRGLHHPVLNGDWRGLTSALARVIDWCKVEGRLLISFEWKEGKTKEERLYLEVVFSDRMREKESEAVRGLESSTAGR